MTSAVRSEPRLRIEDRTLTYNGLHLQIMTWMKSCLTGTHTTSSYIYIQRKVDVSQTVLFFIKSFAARCVLIDNSIWKNKIYCSSSC